MLCYAYVLVATVTPCSAFLHIGATGVGHYLPHGMTSSYLAWWYIMQVAMVLVVVYVVAHVGVTPPQSWIA